MKASYVPAGSVFDLARRKVTLRPDEMYEEIGVRSFGRGIFHKPAVQGIELGDKKVFEIQPGDLVLSNVFAWEGAVAVADANEQNKIGSHRFMTWVPDPAAVDAKYVYHYLMSEVGLRQLIRASPGSAGRNKTLGIQAFKNVRIPLPNLHEQRRIRTRIEALDSWRQATESAERAYEGLQSSLYDKLYQDKAVVHPLGDFLTPVDDQLVVDDNRSYTTAGVRWYGEGLFAKDSKKGSEIKAAKLFKLHPGDFVYNKLFAWKGSFAIVPDDVGPLVASNEFPSFRVDSSRLLPEFLLGWFRQPDVWKIVERLSTGGTPTSRNRLKSVQLLQLEIPVPALEVQVSVVSQLRQLSLVQQLQTRRGVLGGALPQAARNEIFSSWPG